MIDRSRVVHLYQSGESPASIAELLGTYPNAVRRELVAAGVELRTRSEAQKLALERGRHPHPTKDSERPPEVKRAIGEGVSKAWARRRKP